jgi:transcriptional regulator of arginine metabolism
MKNARQSAILEIISSKDIETQHQLIDELEKVGIKSTQATLSRDIKELFLVKELSGEGRYRYVSTQRADVIDHSSRLKAIFRESVTSCVAAQNLIVIKTLPGVASGVCGLIDGMAIHNLAGTIAGDDTAFIAMFDAPSAERFCKEIAKMLL